MHLTLKSNSLIFFLMIWFSLVRLTNQNITLARLKYVFSVFRSKLTLCPTTWHPYSLCINILYSPKDPSLKFWRILRMKLVDLKDSVLFSWPFCFVPISYYQLWGSMELDWTQLFMIIMISCKKLRGLLVVNWCLKFFFVNMYRSEMLIS